MSTFRSNSLGVLRERLSTGTEVVLVLEDDAGLWFGKNLEFKFLQDSKNKENTPLDPCGTE